MATFILVHGAWHGAWCWELLEKELHRLGHETFAMDMPIDQPGLRIDDYAEIVLKSVAGKAADDAYLVGHSFGGMVIPRVARHRPGARLILLCSDFQHLPEEPREDVSIVADLEAFLGMWQSDDLGRVFLSHDDAIKVFFDDVRPDLAEWAVGKLRPHWADAMTKVQPIEPYDDRIVAAIICQDDRILHSGRHGARVRKRLGKDPIVLLGGHSPFLSHPDLLAKALDQIAATT